MEEPNVGWDREGTYQSFIGLLPLWGKEFEKQLKSLSAYTHPHTHFAASQALGFQARFCHTVTMTFSGLGLFTCDVVGLANARGCFQVPPSLPKSISPLFCLGFPHSWLYCFSVLQPFSFPTPLNPSDSRRQAFNKLGSFNSHCAEPVGGLAPLPACRTCLINCGGIWPPCEPP